MVQMTRYACMVLLTSTVLFGCGGSQTAPETPAAPETGAGPGEGGDATDGAPKRPELTAEACTAGGGVVVGDIGDGAIHRPDYRCPGGSEPTGSIRAPEGGPVGVEGSVCCPK